MVAVFRLLSMLLWIYSLFIIIRIILTWFSHMQRGRFVEFISRITDPYLNWWRQKFNLRVGVLDISPIVAMAALSVLQTICSTIAIQGRISLGIILAVCLSAIWSAASFVLGFCLLVLVLRFVAYIGNSNMYAPFWSIVDTISRPLLYRINRIIFGNRQVRFVTGIIASAAVLIVVWIGGRFLIQLLAAFLLGLAG
ncbi:MAG: YggT family protein [Treponema sp.]|nr:YggT family protein [Treponema sp.]